MRDQLIQFKWPVPKYGFKWLEGYRKSLTRITVKGKPAYISDEPAYRFLTWGKSEIPSSDYYPLRDHTGLFRTFANTPPTKDGVLEFANRYGHLGDTPRWQRDPYFFVEGEKVARWGERLNQWIWGILNMRELVSLWDIVRAHDTSALKKKIIWENYDQVRYQAEWEKPADIDGDMSLRDIDAVIASDDDLRTQRIFQQFRPGKDFIKPALYVLETRINKHLSGRVSPRILSSLSTDYDIRDIGLYLVPENLFGAMWLQFSQAISGEKDYDQCIQCGAFFEIGPSIGRKGKKYCSDACRMAAYRKRKESKS